MLGGAAPSKTTRLSKALAGLLIFIFAVQYFFPSSIQYLALVPGRTLPCVWNIVTGGFVTTNIFEVVLEALALLLLARQVEPYYGSREFLLFIVVVNTATCCATFFLVSAWFAVSRDAQYLYFEFSGFHGVLFGLLVALKQVMPELELKTGIVHLKAKHIPGVALVLSTVMCFVVKQLWFLTFAIWGAYTAWLYLRFFQRQPDSSLKGDSSDDFRFASFFPAFLEQPVDMISRGCSAIFRLRHSPSADTKHTSNSSSTSLLGSDPSDASRRRERGARALEERLGQKKAPAGDEEAPAAELPTSSSAAQFYAAAGSSSK